MTAELVSRLIWAEHGFSVREIIRGVEAIGGRPVIVRERERRAGDPPVLVANASRALEVLGWKAEKNLENVLSDAWNFFAAQKMA